MLVSVIIPTYNCGKYIEESIKSVIAQSIKDWEIQIVDDCSTDNTEMILKPYIEKYPSIHYHKLSCNSGPAIARTEAIKYAGGKYIAFLDSDDLWLPNKLEKQIAYMESKQINFCCTAYSQINEKGQCIGVALFPPEETTYKKCILLGDPIGNLTVMYNQERLGKFEVPYIMKRNDYALWLKILHYTHACYGMQEILANYRVRDNSVSSNKLALAKYHWILYFRIEKHNFFRSAFEVSCWAFVKSTGIGLNKKTFD